MSPPSLSIRFPPSAIAVTPPLSLSPPPCSSLPHPQGMSECMVEWRREVGLALQNSISEEHGLRGARLPPKSRRRPPFTAPPAPHERKQTSTFCPRWPLLPRSRQAERIEKAGGASFPHLYMIYTDMMTNGAKTHTNTHVNTLHLTPL